MDVPQKELFPVLPIRNVVIFPGTVVPLRVGRDRSRAAVERSQKDGWLLSVTVKKDTDEEAGISDLHHVGTLCKVEKVRGYSKNGFQILVRGEKRFRVEKFEMRDGMTLAHGHVWEDKKDLDPQVSKALIDSLKSMARAILALLPSQTTQLTEMIDGITDLTFLSFLCAAHLEISLAEKQDLLECESSRDRVLKLLSLMQTQKDSLEVQSEIRDKMSHKMGKMQREAILRQQLSAIREELGEEAGAGTAEDYRTKIENAGMPEAVMKAALDDLKRLESMGNASPETHVIRNYLDLLCAMPWSKSASAEIDLQGARKVLEEDHYGLDKIKRRIIQHLTVMKLKKSSKGSILLFVGPPGVGKTSLGQSVARALGRKFVRGSLGGIRDDAEIRGHRRTYIGAMPGRIIQGIKRAGENNPVFLLDEIDKMSMSFHGDPASALLEVLDPEQNATFLDHYLDVPFDLSKVIFIATANTLQSIPGPLLDRMEIIELSGYTTAEKLHIAKNHLIGKQLEEHGLTSAQLAFTDETILKLINHYTREAGVRELQRQIAALCRACGEKVLSAKEQVRVDHPDLEKLLGPEKFLHEVAEGVSYPGLVTGLAWTPMGGEILFIEAGLMPGSGKLILTGQLGDVMKESAQIALSLIRSKLPDLVPGFEYEKKDLHIHVPAGAIPKDGPSAGIAILTTIASLFSNRSVDSKLAMTGEITLRGAVMPVGGIKEKLIAAHRAGIERVILSKKNQRDLADVPEEVKQRLKLEFVETASDVLKISLNLDVKKHSDLYFPPPTHPGFPAAAA